MRASLKTDRGCPRHGREHLKVVDNSLVCMAPTPDELISKCWYHVNGTMSGKIKYCPTCKTEGVENEINPNRNYCAYHANLHKSAARTKGVKVA